MILTLDLGTTRTKAAVWDERGLRALGRAPVPTHHPAPGRAEQDPAAWWPAVVQACRAARAADPAAFDAVTAVGFAAARQTIVLATAGGDPLGPAILWSDRRATAEAGRLADRCGGRDAIRARTGVVLDGASIAAKLDWLWAHDGPRMAESRWILAPRDQLVWQLTGELVTDTTLASVTGLYDLAGQLIPELAGDAARRLPRRVPPATVVGEVLPAWADQLGIPAGVAVVVGAGDRQCEVLGTGATSDRPMVSWGTTANISIPLSERPDPIPDGLSLTRAAGEGWLLEGGVSAAGSLLDWLARLTGFATDALLDRAATSPPGAGGVVALPWLGGARAPWWDDRAGAAFLGLAPAHGAADLARAAVEGVARDLARCLDLHPGPTPHGLALAGGGTLWTDILVSTTGLPGCRRTTAEAASVGAAIVTASAVGKAMTVDDLNPPGGHVLPDPELVERYRQLRPLADRTAPAVLAALTNASAFTVSG